VRAGATSTDPACYARNELDGQLDPDPRSPYWRERALGGARGSDVPVLWSHGFMDDTAKPDNFLPLWSRLRGPRRAWLGQFAHDRPNDVANSGHEGWFDELFRFLDRYVKGDASARPDRDPPVEVADAGGRWRAEDRWPPADAVRRSMTLRGGQYTDVAGNYAEHDPTGGTATGRGVWSFTAPLAHAAWLSGAALATVRVSTAAASAVLIALVYDVDPQGQATLVTRGAQSLTGGTARTLVFDLSPQDWPLAAGHRLGVLVTGADEDWYLPRHSGAAVDVAGGRLALPFLTHRRDAFLPGHVTPAIQARHPIAVDPATARAATVGAELPPALR
jgi:predicted acyl esterase